MSMHSGKLTRRSLLRGVGLGALAVAAAPVLFDSTTAFAAPAAVGTSNNPNGVDRSGTLIVKPAQGVSIAQINARFGTRTELTFTGGDTFLV